MSIVRAVLASMIAVFMVVALLFLVLEPESILVAAWIVVICGTLIWLVLTVGRSRHS